MDAGGVAVDAGGGEGADWRKDPEPIEKKRVLCNQSDCENGLHSFRTRMRRRSAREGKATYRNGPCAVCGAAAVDWDRLDRRDPGDIGYLIESFKKEDVRHRFWTGPIEKADARRAVERGEDGTRRFAARRMAGLSMPSSKIFRDGTQTPPSGDIVYYAQHATATCCRKCIEEWHGIDRESVLTEADQRYLEGLIMEYVHQRLPRVVGGGVAE